jgi:hypothetical protein
MPTPDELATQLRALADQVAALDDGAPPNPNPQPGPTEPPAAPTNLRVTTLPDGRLQLDWDGAHHVDAWDVLDTLNSAQPVKETVTVPRSIRSAMKPGSAARRYVVVARNKAGESPASDPVDVLATGGQVPTPDPKPDPKPQPNGKHPSDVLDLRNWTIMLPTGTQGDPDNAYVIGKSIPNTLFVEDGAVVFRTDVVNGVHSPNSKYARTEAREMNDANWTKAAWPSAGPRWIEASLAIDASHLSTRKRINGIQIHDGGDDVCQVMLHETQGLGLMHNDGKTFESIDPSYRGERFTCRVEVNANRIQVRYNGRVAVDIPKTGTGWYWKLGCYSQTGGASEFKEPAGSYAQVKVWSFSTGR